MTMLRWLLCVLLLLPVAAVAQDDPFDLDAYHAFLDAHADLDAQGLLSMHQAGLFTPSTPSPFSAALYRDSLRTHYALTAYEDDLLDRHGFMVTERLQPNSFGDGFMDIYKRDLPVFLSTDAVLHAFHMSYDRILQDLETALLAPRLADLLDALRGALPALSEQYTDPLAQTALHDLDVYLTVPATLLSSEDVPPVFSANSATVNELLGLVDEEQAVEYPLFAERCRDLDFSQFTPRGHYTDSPELTRYFQAMIWLGRTELYLIGPKTAPPCRPTEADVQRQIVMSALLSDAIAAAQAEPMLEEIDDLIGLFVGEQDNVTLANLRSVFEAATVAAADLLDPERVETFQEVLAEQSFAEQRINSQILFSDNITDPDALKPASAFMLLGQRFVIDAYVTGSVVFDAVVPVPEPPRLLPSTFDVLYALGNDAAAQFLEDELDTYGYSLELAALRYLIDGYDADFWNNTFYNGWLESIRTLNPPSDRASLPAFMQTAAWWQQKMNTQLAGWAQLRHDNLLYAKQSYTGGITCEFPYSYVEPIPAFFAAMQTLGRHAAEALADYEGMWATTRAVAYFQRFADLNGTLAGIAQKELDGTPLTDSETQFLRQMLRVENICGPEINGWYTEMYYAGPAQSQEPDLVVADVHTVPTDENGDMVGWVMHVGTGPLNMAVVTAEVPEVGPVAFVGPVMSYYEHVSSDFERLTDELWETAYAQAPSARPDFVDLYLADETGGPRPNASLSLATSLEPVSAASDLPTRPLLTQNYPNPFTDRTTIRFSVPQAVGTGRVVLAIYDVQGRRLSELVNEALPGGHYAVPWDGTLAGGTRAASGTYFYRLEIGDRHTAHAMTLVR